MSDKTIIASGRLTAYLLATFCVEGTISSEEISRLVGVNATQVRRDLSQILGRSGKRGVGYDAEKLTAAIRRVLLAQETIGSGAPVLVSAALRGVDAKVGDVQASGLLAELAVRAQELDRLLLGVPA